MTDKEKATKLLDKLEDFDSKLLSTSSPAKSVTRTWQKSTTP